MCMKVPATFQRLVKIKSAYLIRVFLMIRSSLFLQLKTASALMLLYA